jgi:hypothetical protein
VGRRMAVQLGVATDNFYALHEQQYRIWMAENSITFSNPLAAHEYFSSRMFQYRDMKVVANQSTVADMSHALHNYFIGGLRLTLVPM